MLLNEINSGQHHHEQLWQLLFQRSCDALLLVDQKLDVLKVNAPGRELCSVGHNLHDIEKITSQDDERRSIITCVRWSLKQQKQAEGRVIYLKHNNADMHVDIYPVKTPVNGALVFLKEPTQALDRTVQHTQPTKLFKLGLTAAGITHEMSNPVNALYSQLEMMQINQEAPDHKLEACLSLVSRMRGTLRELSGIMEDSSSLVPGWLDLQDYIPKVIELLKFCPNGREILIAQSIAPGIPQLNIAEKQLILLLENLCDNAIKAAGKGGSLEIRSTVSPDSGLIIKVINSGRRHAPSEQPDHNYQDGMGIGLQISKQIIENSGGEIKISRATDGGTEVKITFPASCCRPQPEQQA